METFHFLEAHSAASGGGKMLVHSNVIVGLNDPGGNQSHFPFVGGHTPNQAHASFDQGTLKMLEIPL